MKRLAFALLFVAPLAAQKWDIRFEIPRPTGQSLPQTLLSGSSELVRGDLSTGRGGILSLNRELFRLPIFKLEAGAEVATWKSDGTIQRGSNRLDSALKQSGFGLGLNAQAWIPFIGLGGEIGLIQRFQNYKFESSGASSDKNLSRTWLRVGARWRIPSVLIHPYVAASYQQPLSKDKPVQLGSVSDFAAYLSAQGNGQEFDRMWTFGVGITF
jgi:hypothetical protein